MAYIHRREDVRAVQAAHSVPTPRIGGIAVLSGTVIAGLLSENISVQTTWLLAPSLVPVVFAGLAEDLGYNVRPRVRLLAAALSSALCIGLFDVWIPRTDMPGLDLLISLAPVAIALTILGGAGICNAFNLVDGLNGLSSLIGITVALSLAVIAQQGGRPEIMAWGLVLAAALGGFLLFNFPFGKIFMGDAGAYGIGHLLAWLSFLLLALLPTLTPWALLLVFFWPLADTALAIARRRRAGKPTDQPDRLHFHQLVMRMLEISKLGRNTRHIANPLSTLVMVPMFVAPSVAGVMFWNNPDAAALALLLFSVLFVTTYSTGILVARSCRRRSGRRFLLELALGKVGLLRKQIPAPTGR
ncbi:MraY family glycosyltransferase [Celeribacter indicus]|nr:glycosyltransferase [Celeribacter indicus]